MCSAGPDFLMYEDCVQNNAQLLCWLLHQYIEPNVRQWCRSVFVAFLKRLSPSCFSLEVLFMEEKEQSGHQAGQFEMVVRFECVWYEQLVLILLLLFLAAVVDAVLFVMGLLCACA
jgi:hypothetical protein